MACETVPFPDDINAGDFDPDFVWGAATSAYQVWHILVFLLISYFIHILCYFIHILCMSLLTFYCVAYLLFYLIYYINVYNCGDDFTVH